jgi:hypothetical protein
MVEAKQAGGESREDWKATMAFYGSCLATRKEKWHAPSRRVAGRRKRERTDPECGFSSAINGDKRQARAVGGPGEAVREKGCIRGRKECRAEYACGQWSVPEPAKRKKKAGGQQQDSGSPRESLA